MNAEYNTELAESIAENLGGLLSSDDEDEWYPITAEEKYEYEMNRPVIHKGPCVAYDYESSS